MMACPEEIMRQERSYLTILGAAERYQIQERQLQIFNWDDCTRHFMVK